jgi:hypothetical protein
MQETGLTPGRNGSGWSGGRLGRGAWSRAAPRSASFSNFNETLDAVYRYS